MTRAELILELEGLRQAAAGLQRHAAEDPQRVSEFITQYCIHLQTVLTRLQDSGKQSNLPSAPPPDTLTERANAPENAAEARLHALLENSSDSVSVVDPLGRTQWSSPSGFRLLGYSMEETIGQRLYTLVHPLDLPKAIQISLKVLTNPGVCFQTVVRCRHKDGTWRWVEARSTNLLNNPSVRGVVLNCRDITQERQMQEALGESEERLRLAQNVAGIGIWEYDCTTQKATWTPELERLYGLQPGTVTDPEVFTTMVHSDDVAHCLEERNRAIAEHRPFEFEYRINHASGPQRWLAAKGGAMYGSDGKPTRVLAATSNITEHKLADEALRQSRDELERRVLERTESLRTSEERFRQVADNIDQVIWVYNLDPTECLYINKAYEAICGRPTGNLYRNPLTFLESVHPEDRFIAERILAEKFYKGIEFGTEVRLIHPDGLLHWVIVQGFPIVDASGRPYRMVGFVQDITQRRQLEEALLDVAEREQQRMAQDLHDGLCSQLTGLGFLAKALEQELTGDPKTIAHNINLQLRNALDQARSVAHGLHPISITPTSLPDALKRLATEQGKLYGIDCRFHGAAHFPSLNPARATHLYRIAQESVHNAIKHGNAKRIIIQLSVRDDQLILNVRDNGTGLPKGLSEHVGIGTQIMQHRADTIGALLTISNVKPAGTVVTCQLPLPSNFSKET